MSESLARLFGDLHLPAPDGRTVVDLLPAVEELGRRGYVVVCKWDGERDPDAGDNGPCTVLISGGDLSGTGDFFRIDDSDMASALSKGLTWLAEWRHDRR